MPLHRSRARRRTTSVTTSRPVDVTIRRAHPGDSNGLRRLAALDDASLPLDDVVVAEVASELWAAITADGALVVADPFRPTAQIVDLLHACAADVRSDEGDQGPLRRMIPLLRAS